MYTSQNVDDIVKTVTCKNSLDIKECMYRECKNCKESKVPKSNAIDMGKQVKWRMWKNRRIETEKKTMLTQVIREVESGTLETLDSEVNKEVERAARHIFNIRHQYKAMAFLKDNMTEQEIFIHMDFSENYNCKLQSEIQSMHFGASQRQISIHTGIAYTKEKLWPFATVSDCLLHSPAGIWGHLYPIFDCLKPSEHGQTIIHFLSDGPTTQYRNKTNMFLFSTKIFDFGFQSGTWNFLEAGHGKGAADGIGAVVKRTGDRHVLAGHDIKCAADLKNALKDSSIHVFEVTESDIMAIEIPTAANIKAVPQTMRIHQVTATNPGIVYARELSCFCNRLNVNGCSCFKPVMTVFDKDKILEKSSCDDLNCITTNQIPENTIKETLSGYLTKVIVVDEDLIGLWAVVEYDGLPYPGEILDVDENDVEVKVMHKIGQNRFFWPLIPDILWYEKKKVVTLLDGPPEKVTGRHCQVHPDVWRAIEAEMDL
ncbi:uncharacterized protein LOC132746584 [Ruditapes philippinarum]|uniref:uncharacterized protein LOC132746584 n=1 Tax=Ruditapes philippinarum TaxID=129788 RepID=UPI00295A5704|nr:uncharacterized protein LOC132746584 [Ruditapes philippinarum]